MQTDSKFVKNIYLFHNILLNFTIRKCHCESEPHMRQMDLLKSNPHRFIDDFSKQFEYDFMNLMRTRFFLFFISYFLFIILNLQIQFSSSTFQYGL